ncbi:MAG: hypothetical protein JXA42_26455, partial [Anaerolineales bacterium]|nr:hypothetical protein [Anaerolineales bacterium]
MNLTSSGDQLKERQRKPTVARSLPAGREIASKLEAGEWNDSQAGDYLWSNANFGEALAGTMTPLTWTVQRLLLEEWAFLRDIPITGNIGGRIYLNLSVPATVFHALGRSRHDLLEVLEGSLYTNLPGGMQIPLVPVSRWSVLSYLPNLVGIQMRQMQGVRALPTFLAQNPARSRRIVKKIAKIDNGLELRSLWQQEIEPHITRGVWIVLGSASRHADYSAKLRRELAELVGPDDADTLISNLSDEADGSNLLASLKPLVGLARVARGEMEREAYLEQS